MCWNATGFALRQNSHASKGSANEVAAVVNVCANQSWKEGLRTKTIHYLRYLNSLPYTSDDDAHVLLMDSDTVWAISHIEDLWRRYDSVRRGRNNLVISTEMNCWIGQHCNALDIDYYYTDNNNHENNINTTFSRFINSGLIMGNLSSVLKLLKHCNAHHLSYRVNGHYRDQFAVTDYVQNHASPSEVTLDTSQHLFGSVRVFSPANESVYKVLPRFPRPSFTCVAPNLSIVSPCIDWTPFLFSQNYFRVSPATCAIERRPYLVKDESLAARLMTLSSTPGRIISWAYCKFSVHCKIQWLCCSYLARKWAKDAISIRQASFCLFR